MDCYIDALLGSSGNPGTELKPKQLISQAPMAADNRIFLRRSQTHDIANYRFMLSGMTLGAYGEGANPVLKKQAGGDAWIYIRDAIHVTIQDIDLDANGHTGALISVNAQRGQTVADLTISGVRCIGSPDHCGLFVQGIDGGIVRDLHVSYTHFIENGEHGTICVGDVERAGYTRCLAKGNGHAKPAHGFSAYAQSAMPSPRRIRWYICEAGFTVDFDGREGQGFQADDNSRECSMIGVYSHDNQGAGACANQSRGHLITGNILTSNGKSGIYAINGVSDLRVTDNSFAGNGWRGGYEQLQVSGPGCVTQGNRGAGR